MGREIACPSLRQLPILAAELAHAADRSRPRARAGSQAATCRASRPREIVSSRQYFAPLTGLGGTPKASLRRARRARREQAAAMSMSSVKIRGGEVFLVALPIRRPHHWVGHTARSGEGYAVLRSGLARDIRGSGDEHGVG